VSRCVGMLAEASPDEIWLLDLTNAGTYQFIAEDGSPLNRHHAFTVIQRDGCVLIDQKWVDNHWGQILWKIAGQVQAKPSLFDEKWNWGEVIAQLKYRYIIRFQDEMSPAKIQIRA
jgi:breast cancer 2 susceptibility protein